MKVFSFAILAAAAGASASASAVASLRGSNEQMKRDLKINDIGVDVNLPDQAEAVDVDLDFNAGGNSEVGGGNSANGGVGNRFNGAGGGGGGGDSCPVCGNRPCCKSCIEDCDLFSSCSFTCA